MQTRTITNSGHPLQDITGAVLADTSIVFDLVDANSRPAGEFAVSGEYIAPGPYSVTTDAGGFFSITLPCTDSLVEQRFYICTVDHPDCPEFMSALVYDAAPLLWVDFMGSGTTPPAAVVDPFTRHIQDISLHTPAGTGHTHDNKEVLDQFGESNGEPTYNNRIIATQLTAIDGGTF